MTISWDQNDESLLRGGGGNLVFEDPGRRNLRGDPNFHLQVGGPNPLDSMDKYKTENLSENEKDTDSYNCFSPVLISAFLFVKLN